MKIKLKQEELFVKNGKMVHRCADCWTIFDENVELHSVCPVCEADKTTFEWVNFADLHAGATN